MCVCVCVFVCVCVCVVFTTEGFFEVAIESWPECDSKPRPLNSFQTLQPTELSGHELQIKLVKKSLKQL